MQRYRLLTPRRSSVDGWPASQAHRAGGRWLAVGAERLPVDRRRLEDGVHEEKGAKWKKNYKGAPEQRAADPSKMNESLRRERLT